MYICIYIYIYIDRQIDRQIDRYRYIYVYVYIFLCVYMYVDLCTYTLLSIYVLLHTFVCIKVIYLYKIVYLVDSQVATSRLALPFGQYPSILFRNHKVEYNHLHKLLYSGNKNQPSLFPTLIVNNIGCMYLFISINSD